MLWFYKFVWANVITDLGNVTTKNLKKENPKAKETKTIYIISYTIF